MDVTGKMNLRRPTRNDAGEVLALMLAWDIADYGSEDSTMEDLLDQWSKIDLERDAWLLVTPEGQIRGYAAVSHNEQRFTIELYIHPNLAGADVRGTLLEACESRIGEVLREDPSAPKDAVIFISKNQAADEQAVQARGYQTVRYHLRMEIDLDTPPENAPLPDGLTLRNFIPGEDDRQVHSLIQEAFDRPGRTPQTIHDWQDFMMGAYNFEPELWFLAFSGDALIGAILCFDYPQYGWVRQLAVNAQWRGKGIGKFLLKHAFQVLYARGKRSVGLGVDAENDTAFQVYERAGMRRSRQFAEYKKTFQR